MLGLVVAGSPRGALLLEALQLDGGIVELAERVAKLHAGGEHLEAAGRVLVTGVRARAGKQSALGRIKFDFDNPYGVYLHDTPTQGTFDRYSRLASHGCVRLAHPLALAKLVLKDSTDWTPEAIDATLAKGDTVRARLPERIAVYLLYWTAFGSADGKMSFRDDPYGWDSLLASRIEARADRAPVLASGR